MSLVRNKNTKPEKAVRRALTELGLRYRLHSSTLAGRPDVVITRLKTVVFVHGCFWHRHIGCARTRIPKSPEIRSFWESKFASNVLRDELNQKKLKDLGWKVVVIWECESENYAQLKNKLLNEVLTGA